MSQKGGELVALIPGVTESPIKDRILPESPVFDEAFWVSVAEGAIRDYCDWHVAPVRESVFSLDGGRRHRLILPTLRLREVKSVLLNGREAVDRVKASESGILELHERFPCGLGSVVVKVSHGYDPDEVPSLMGVIASAASRFADSLGNVVQSQSAGGSAVSFFMGSESLLSSEKEKLDRYRLRGRA